MQKLNEEFEKNKNEEIQHHNDRTEEENNRLAEMDREIKLQTEENKKEIADLNKKHNEMKAIIQEEYSQEMKKLKDAEANLKNEIALKEQDHLKKKNQNGKGNLEKTQ